MLRQVVSTVAVLSFFFAACSSSGGDGGGSGSCDSIAGQYSISGNCSDSSCYISQQGCQIALSCDVTGSLSGSISGNKLSFGDSETHCSGTFSGKTGSGSCSYSGGSCTFSAACVSGACLEEGFGGSGGGSGGSGGYGATGGGGSGGSGGASCGVELSGMSAACNSCAAQNCCSLLESCWLGSNDCVAFDTCLAENDAASSACFQGGSSELKACLKAICPVNDVAYSLWYSALMCVVDKCPNQCS